MLEMCFFLVEKLNDTGNTVLMSIESMERVVLPTPPPPLPEDPDCRNDFYANGRYIKNMWR